jgi:hypothetical protein
MNKLKRTTEDVKKYFEEQGCELLGEYLGVQIKMKYRCKCGNISEINWNHFSHGKRCGLCVKTGQKKKRSLEEIQKIFKERGCEFLDLEFKGITYKHNYKCKCGKIKQITFSGFHHQNQYCNDCRLEKNRGSNHHMWQEDREQVVLNKKFRKKCYKALQSSLKATGKVKVGRTTDMLGYSPKELQEHITKHPNWENVKREDWAIDHIFPIKAFIDYGIKDIKVINRLDNLRPISKKRKW